ncbi:MAG: multidrug transporter [Chloroflexia bacterium]|nr:multidrug transporter [Chloroflexia bacterium]
MRRVILKVTEPIPPFNEAARDLRILNKPLWLLQRDLLARYCEGEIEVDCLEEIPSFKGELLIHRDNLFFNAPLIDTFVQRARERGRPCQIAFALDDASIAAHALRLQEGIRRQGDRYVAELYYYPQGFEGEPEPLVMDTLPREMGYYHIPSYMAPNMGDLIFQVPWRTFLSIESWLHIWMANVPFGVFCWGRIQEQEAEESWRVKIRIALRAILERKHFLSTSEVVKVGKNCSIDPSALIQGPTVIGNNVHIGAGAVITNSLIGNNVTVMQGSQVMLSVVSDYCYLPFRAALFMTAFMENSMVAQNTCLQLCVVGRNSFIGANNVFTDFNLLGKPIRIWHKGELLEAGLPVLGGCVGHDVKIGSGFVIYPARSIESGSVLVSPEQSHVITRNLSKEQSQGYRWIYSKEVDLHKQGAEGSSEEEEGATAEAAEESSEADRPA